MSSEITNRPCPWDGAVANAVAVATEAEIAAGADCGQLAMIVENEAQSLLNSFPTM